MAIKTTTYSPDTCTCVIQYSWDDSVPSDQRVHTPTTVIQKCPAHASLATAQDVFNTVVGIENPRKNQTIQKILDNAPAALFDLAQDGTRIFKQGITATWSWSGSVPNRILTVTITGTTLTQNQKNNIQTTLDNIFGAGNVILVNP